MNPTAATEPRLIIRSVSDFTVRAGVIHARAFGHDDVTALIVMTIYSGNVAHYPYDDPAALDALPGTPGAAARLRPVSVNAVAASIGMAYETVRERVEALCRRGLFERQAGGVTVSEAGMADPALIRSWHDVQQRFVIMLRQLAMLGLDIAAAFKLPARPMRVAPPPLLVARIVNDFEVRLLGNLVPTFGSILRGHIWSTVLAFNLEHLLFDPVRAWHHATVEQECDAARRRVTVRAVATHLEQPYETTRRHMRALAAAGAIVETAQGGFYVPRPPVPNPPLDTYNAELITSFARTIALLHRLGFALPGQTSRASSTSITGTPSRIG